MSITERLIKPIQNSQLVVIHDLPDRGNTSEAISKERVISQLANMYHIEEKFNLEDIVEYCVEEYGRADVINTLVSVINDDDSYPLYYDLLDELNIKYFIELHSYPLWRHKMSSEKRGKYAFHSRNDDFLGDEKKVFISLFGDVIYSTRELILQQSEFNGFIANANSVSSSIRSLLKGTLLFVNFDPSSLRFKALYDYICQVGGQYPSVSYMVTETVSTKLSYGEKQNLFVERTNIYDFCINLRNYVNQKKPIRSTKKVTSKKQSSLPYKYLFSFEREDHGIFFGRDKEVNELEQLVCAANQIAVLTSSSGYGKTSLINAGLIPRMLTREYDVFYIRSDTNPWKSVVEGVFQSEFENFDLNVFDVKSVFREKRQLIIVDQFEECFVNNDIHELKLIDEHLKRLLSKHPSITVLISIRQDFLAYITNFAFLGNTQFSATYNLTPMSEDSAMEAIIKPTELFSFSYEEGLVNKIIFDLSNNENNSFVDPSQLQIVCYFLYQEMINSNITTITEDIYSKLGKAKTILENYIDISLRNYTPREQSIGKEILKSLVSSKGTRLSKPIFQIVAEVKNNNANIGHFDEDEIVSVITKMINSRLVRTKATDDADANFSGSNKRGIQNSIIELTHEYIIQKIHEWVDIEALEFKKISELFNNAFQNWTFFRSNLKELMSSELFYEIYNNRDRFLFNTKEKSYLALCYVSYDSYDSDSADVMRYLITENRNNLNCVNDFEWAFKYLHSRSKIYAGVLLSLLCPGENTFQSIYDRLKNLINPHFENAERYFIGIGESIDPRFSASMHNLLSDARKKGMCKVPPNMDVRLGLSESAGKRIIREEEIAVQLKSYFPNKERTVGFTLYYIDETTVTNKMYYEYDESHRYNVEHEDYPVVGLNFEQALAYARWWGKDLPYEDEWEYAARGDDFRYFPWGNEWDYESEKSKPESEKLCNASLTGTDGARGSREYVKGKSPFGCFNMSGNVWEWTKTPVTNEDKRVIVKGGSWSFMKIKPWVWYRYSYDRSHGQHNVGFRCVFREGKNV